MNEYPVALQEAVTAYDALLQRYALWRLRDATMAAAIVKYAFEDYYTSDRTKEPHIRTALHKRVRTMCNIIIKQRAVMNNEH